jgi:hypothetical protein
MESHSATANMTTQIFLKMKSVNYYAKPWNESNLGSSLGDVAHHVIDVGTCCPNLHDYMWAGGLAVKCALLQLQRPWVFKPTEKHMFFCTKLN